MNVSKHTTQCVQCKKKLTGLQRKFCSSLCKNRFHQPNCIDKQSKRGLSRKLQIIKNKGGKCQTCGYNKNYATLCFHHRDSNEKSFQLDMRSLSNRSLQKCLDEADKCDLLCHNCHSELHHPHCTL